MKVETDIIDLLYNIESDSTCCDTSDNVCRDMQNWRYCLYRKCHNVFDITLTDNFQYHCLFIETKNITRYDQRKTSKDK